MCMDYTFSTTIPNEWGLCIPASLCSMVEVDNWFVPFRGVGQGTVRGIDFNDTVNVSPGAAVLQVDQGGTLVLNP